MKTIITCALTGAVPTRDQTPYLPVTPDEISESGLEAAEAGASILHIHVRNTQNGFPSMDIDLYRDTVNKIKKKNKKVLINLTTGPGAVYVLGKENLAQGDPRSILLHAEQRVKHIEIIKPHICSLDFNTMHQGNLAIRINHINILKEMAHRIVKVGTVPELELFDSGDFRIAKELYDQSLLGSRMFWQFAMGIKYGWDHTPEALMYAKNLLPKDSVWSAFGISKMQMPFVAMSWCLGGHVRVGLEDNIYISKGNLAKSNSELVKKAVGILTDLGGDIASPKDAKEILGIR